MTVAVRPQKAYKFDGEVASRHRSTFCDIAADMEMGYYTDPEGHQWDARPFVIKQVLLSMGYGLNRTEDKREYPIWWPGQDAMRRMVSLKVMLRQAQSRAGSGGHPWIEPLLAASVEEVLNRLYTNPTDVGFRELVDLTTKLARLQSEQRKSGFLSAPGQLAPGETVAIQRVTETIMRLPPEEQERARKAIDVVNARMREAMPAVEP